LSKAPKTNSETGLDTLPFDLEAVQLDSLQPKAFPNGWWGDYVKQ